MGEFFIGAWVGAMTIIVVVASTSGPATETVHAYGKLKQANVYISVSEGGNFYLWNEKTKTSTKVSEREVINMAKNLPEQK